MHIQRNAPYSPPYFKDIPTNRIGELVRLVFTNTISATVFHKDGRKTVIKEEDLPKEFRSIKTLAVFQSFFSNAFATVGIMSNNDCSLRISQRVLGGIDDDLAEATNTLMAEGLETIRRTPIASTALMMVGKVGAGQSVLANFLAGVDIVGVPFADGKFQFASVNPLMPASDDNTQARCPGMHTPERKRYTIVDLPGFGQGAYQEIASAYFRAEIIKKTKNLKVLFLVPYSDIYGPGTNFLETLTHLILQFGCCQTEEGLRKAAASITLVVTQVEQAPVEIAELERKVFQKQKILECLKGDGALVKQTLIDRVAKELSDAETQLEQLKRQPSVGEEVEGKLRNFLMGDSPLSDREKRFLGLLLDQKKWTIFSAPKKEGASLKALQEKDAILRLVECRETVIRKGEANFQLKVPERYEGQILESMTVVTNKLKTTFVDLMIHDLDEYLKRLFREGTRQELLDKKNRLSAMIEANVPCSLMRFVNDFTREFTLQPPTLQEAAKHAASLKFLGNLLREDLGKRWLTELELQTSLTTRVNWLEQITAPAQINHTDGTVIFKGYFLNTNQLNTFLRNGSFATVMKVKIFALSTLTFDEDLTSDKLAGANFSFVAPKVIVLNHCRIKLSGADCTHSYTSAASNGKEWGEAGAHGDPGHEGGSGGNLFGLVRSMTASDPLRVASKGGRSGDGQKAGNGYLGKKGAHASREERGAPLGGIWKRVDPFDGNGNSYHFNPGEPGGQGGDAGMGGARGFGGLPGTVTIISLNGASPPVVTELAHGDRGSVGAHGRAGAGGANGKNWHGVLRFFLMQWNRWHPLMYDENDKTFAPAGNVPTDVNRKNRIEPTPVAPINIQSLLSGFRAVLTEESNPLTEAALLEFRNHYENHPDLRGRL